MVADSPNRSLTTEAASVCNRMTGDVVADEKITRLMA
jgi:hypothetical protein